MPEGSDRPVGQSELDSRAIREVAALQSELDRRFTAVQRERDMTSQSGGLLLESERLRVNGLIRVLEERLNGIDRATSLLSETVNQVPTDVQQAIANMRDVMNEKFGSIATQFQERDTRSERESRDNKVAVDAAFAAQKEAAAKQDESNAKAIDKSEAATTETINKLSELFRSSNDALADKIDDLKSRITQIESRAVGGLVERTDRFAGAQDSRGQTGLYFTAAGLFLTVVLILMSVAVATHGFTR